MKSIEELEAALFPTEFPEEIEPFNMEKSLKSSAKMSMLWGEFEANKERLSDDHFTKYALGRVKAHVKAKLPIPNELIPYALSACDGAIKELGFSVKKKDDEKAWKSRMIDIQILMDCGYKVKESIEIIKERDKIAIESESIKRYRSKPEYAFTDEELDDQVEDYMESFGHSTEALEFGVRFA